MTLDAITPDAMTLDAVAQLILDEAGPLTGRVLVIDDHDGALTRAALAQGCEVRAFCDDLRDADALPPHCRVPDLDAATVAASDLVLWRLPKSLGALEDVAGSLSAGASGLRVVAGGRVKHMTRGQNEVLGAAFSTVTASLGRQKCRVLHASHPTGAAPRWPKTHVLQELGLTVVAHGGTFSTNRLDAGTRLLLSAVVEGSDALPAPETPDGPGRAIDLGCGSGIIACVLARRGYTVTATDVSAAAVASTRLTAEANGLDVTVVQRDGLAGCAAASADLIVTNPPFHRGAEKDSTPTLSMIADAGRVLAPGGEFWCVFNSHLPYLPALRDAIGSTSIVARDRSYTVTRSIARASRS